MKRDFAKLFGASTLVLGMLAGPALAEVNWDDFDKNADNKISEEEVSEGYGDGGSWLNWDSNQDDQVTRDEYNESVFGLFDEDDSGEWDEEEYAAYSEAGDSPHDTSERMAWDDLDADQSGGISEEEVSEGFGDGGSWLNWDSNEDDVVTRDEYSSGVFDMYDEDDSGDWDQEEFQAFADRENM